MDDPRLTPARPEVAAKYLEGKVQAARFVEGEVFEVVEAVAPLRQGPFGDAELATQALKGERVTVYDGDGEGFGQVGTAVGDVERGYKIPLRIVDWGGGAAQPRVAGVKMLVAVDCQGTLFNQTGADAVGTLALFVPDGSSPKTPGMKRLVIDKRAAPFDRHAVTIGEQDAAPDAAHREIETVETRLGSPDERFDTLPGFSQFSFRQIAGRAAIGWIEPVQTGRPPPGGNQRGFRRRV